MDITPVSTVINASSLRLLKSFVFSNSQTRLFYTYLIGQHDIDSNGKTFYGRTLTYARENCINLMNYIFNDKYNCVIELQLKCTIAEGQCGLVDSIRLVINDYSYINRNILNLLFRAF